jgi:hypothetical protein
MEEDSPMGDEREKRRANALLNSGFFLKNFFAYLPFSLRLRVLCLEA